LRVYFVMGIVNLDDIKPLINTGKTISRLSSAPAGEDDWARFERVIQSIKELLNTVQDVQQTNQNPAGNRRILSNDGRIISVEQPVRRITNTIIKEDNPMKKEIITAIKTHIEKCVTENPNMTIGEAIDKIPINVTQALALIRLFEVVKN